VILPDTLESVGRTVWEHTPFLTQWKQSWNQDRACRFKGMFSALPRILACCRHYGCAGGIQRMRLFKRCEYRGLAGCDGSGGGVSADISSSGFVKT